MSTRKKKPAAAEAEPSTSTAVLDPPAPAEPDPEFQFEEQELGEHQPWEGFAANDHVGFFELMDLIPSQAWEDSLLIYLYRLDPPVANKSGEKKYICRYSQPIDEETIKAQHGGGKYHAILKRGTDTIKNAKFSIQGEPILLKARPFAAEW